MGLKIAPGRHPSHRMPAAPAFAENVEHFTGQLVRHRKFQQVGEGWRNVEHGGSLEPSTRADSPTRGDEDAIPGRGLDSAFSLRYFPLDESQ